MSRASLVGLWLVLAVGGPALLAFNEPPSPTALNQAVALGAWGSVLAAVATITASWFEGVRNAWTALVALLIVAAAALLASTLGVLPWTLSRRLGLREFRNPGSKAFFEPCDEAQVVDSLSSASRPNGSTTSATSGPSWIFHE